MDSSVSFLHIGKLVKHEVENMWIKQNLFVRSIFLPGVN